MENDNKHGMTVKDTATIALTAYVGVKVFKALASTTVSAISFRRARKADKPIAA